MSTSPPGPAATPMAGAPLRVLCVTPSGVAGRGGIDRLYYYLREAGVAMPGIDLRYGAARGASGAAWPLAFPARLAALAYAMLRFRPQVVHVNVALRGSLPRKLAVAWLARAFGARVAVHLHDVVPATTAVRSSPRNRLQLRLFLALCRRADIVIALGRPAVAQMHALGIDPARLRIVLNGIPDFASDLALPKADRGDATILFAGHVGPRKGAGVLLDALAILRRRGVGTWRCTMAGDGKVDAHAAQAARLGLTDAVRFTGWLDADAVHALMREAEIVVLPSNAEALPLSLIEGACAGAALVATRIGNTEEVVRDGETGRLVARDPEALADALAELIADRAARTRMQAAARRHFTGGLTIEAFAAGLHAVYVEMAAMRGPVSDAAAGSIGDADRRGLKLGA